MATQHYTLLLLLLLLLTSLFTTSFSAHRCHPSDLTALLKIQKGLNNPYTIISWDAKEDCCDWYCCVKCDDKTNRVISIDIANDAAPTSIPSAVGDLEYLQDLTLRKLPNLTGPIPPSIKKLKHLKSLWLDWNNLTGPVPDFLADLPDLEYINLGFNKLDGPIPDNLSKLKKLGSLFIDRNKLTGHIPESLGEFTGTVPYIRLSHNQLTGPIPKSFAKIDFTSIDLSRNKLVGDASMLFKPNGSTQTLDLSRNMLAFDFSKVKFPKKTLISLDLNHNKIYGSIPKDIVKIDDLQQFNVSYNRLCGEIPSGGDMARFDYSTYIHNKCLCGPPLAECK